MRHCCLRPAGPSTMTTTTTDAASALGYGHGTRAALRPACVYMHVCCCLPAWRVQVRPPPFLTPLELGVPTLAVDRGDKDKEAALLVKQLVAQGPKEM